MTVNIPSKPYGRRFSLRLLMGVIAVCAIMLGLGRVFFYEHPAHQFPAYGRAPYTTAYRYQAGPNTIAIRSIARNRYDGAIHLISAGGLSTQVPHVDQLIECAKWLDVVQIELTPGPELVEIVDSRVFDHESRTLLNHVSDAYGWRVTDTNLIQVYGMGKEVPEKLDVWLRLRSYPDDTVYSIGVTPGSEIAIPGGTIRVAEVKEGYSGWSKGVGFHPTAPSGGSGSAILFEWQGNWRGKSITCTAVTDLGERMPYGESLKPEWNGNFIGPAWTRCSLALVDHLELRSHCEEQKFFYDGVKVPPLVERKFDPPPIGMIKTDQGEVAGVLHEFAPLLIHYRIEEGHTGGIISQIGSSMWLERSGPHRERDTTFSILVNEWGIGAMPLAFRLQDANLSTWSPVANGVRAIGDNCFAFDKVIERPLAEVKSIELTISAP